MVRLKLNGQSYTSPSCYEEIKTRQYVRIATQWDQTKDIADRDYFQLFNIITDGSFTDFARTVENEITFHNAISWVLTQDFKFSTILPKTLFVSGKLIDIPREIGELSIGQHIHLRRDYIDKSKYLEENLSIATAIYLQPKIDDGQFSMKRAIEIAKEIDEMPAYLIYPVGFFFAKTCHDSWNQARKDLTPAKDQPKADVKQNVARLAKVHRLNPYDDLDLIDQYATRYGLDPDWVFFNAGFDTVIAFLVKWKEEAEYRERFQSIWEDIHNTPKK